MKGFFFCDSKSFNSKPAALSCVGLSFRLSEEEKKIPMIISQTGKWRVACNSLAEDFKQSQVAGLLPTTSADKMVLLPQ